MKTLFHLLTLFFVLCSFLQASEPAKKTPQLISYWPADGNAKDVVGSNDGQLHGASFTTGKFGQAFQFNGVDQYVSAGTNNLPTGKHDRTLMLWARIDSIVSAQSFFAGYGEYGQWNQVYELFAHRIDERLSSPDWSQWGGGTYSPLTFKVKKWRHFAVSNHGKVTTLYMGGKPVGVSNAPIETPAGTQFFLGRVPGTFGDGDNPGLRLNGAVDDIKIFDGSFSACEIAEIYKSDLAR